MKSPRVFGGKGEVWQVTVFYPRRVEVKRFSSREEAEGVIQGLLPVLEEGGIERLSVKLQEASPSRTGAALPVGVGAVVRR